MNLAIATSAAYPDLWEDDVVLAPALARLGIDAVPRVWTDPQVDWSAFDAVLIRSTWDYYERYPAFLAWLDALDAGGVPTINDSALLRWNSEKRYLTALAAAGIPIIETEICAANAVRAAVEARGGKVVVKPTISGNAMHTVRGTAGDPAFVTALDALPREFDYLVQPYVVEIETAGEWSLVFVDGTYSHGIRKLPAAGDYRIQHDYGGAWHSAEPDPSVVDAAVETLRAAAALGYADQAYARVDGIVIDGRFRLMELEMVEPYLAFHLAPEAAALLARAVARRLS